MVHVPVMCQVLYLLMVHVPMSSTQVMQVSTTIDPGCLGAKSLGQVEYSKSSRLQIQNAFNSGSF